MLDGQFTLGVEEEYQIVHPETGELRSYVSRLLEEGGKSVLRERVRAEMHQSMVEVGTSICQNIGDVRRELTEMRRELSRLAERGGLRIVAASTHPFSDWKAQDITDHERYHGLVEELQEVARANLIFGLHVHVGIKDREDATVLANQVRYFLPHLLALTTSSPLWLGRATGLASTRSEIFKRFPRTGIPDEFRSYSAFTEFVDLLVRTKCIDNAKKIWWDVRVHPFFETVEIRVCDMPTKMDHTIAIVALVQALMAKLYMLRRQNLGWRTYPRSLIEENKWRAVRYGIHGKLIDFGKSKEVPIRDLVFELIDFVDDAAARLGTREQVQAVAKIFDEGTSADRQTEVFRAAGNDPKAVVQWLIRETMNGIPEGPAASPSPSVVPPAAPPATPLRRPSSAPSSPPCECLRAGALGKVQPPEAAFRRGFGGVASRRNLQDAALGRALWCGFWVRPLMRPSGDGLALRATQCGKALPDLAAGPASALPGRPSGARG